MKLEVKEKERTVYEEGNIETVLCRKSAKHKTVSTITIKVL